MKVLHLPENSASQLSVTVRALRDLGVDARGLLLGARRNTNDTGCGYLPVIDRPKASLRGLWQRLRFRLAVVRAIYWADVVHWHFDSPVLPSDEDLRLCERLGKARVVEFWGSDIRIPEIQARGNPYMAHFVRKYGDMLGSRERSEATQRRFARYGFRCIVPGSVLALHLVPGLFDAVYPTQQRVMTEDYTPRYPDPQEREPLVIHTPGNPLKKGTEAVPHAIEELKRSHKFRFRLLANVTREEVVQAMAECDVMLDQFLIGGHGTATLEAMAFGKPVVCYIPPNLVERFPPGLPIVNASMDTLPTVLGDLLTDGARRHAIGRKSRAYVEKYHDAKVVARGLIAVYSKLLAEQV